MRHAGLTAMLALILVGCTPPVRPDADDPEGGARRVERHLTGQVWRLRLDLEVADAEFRRLAEELRDTTLAPEDRRRLEEFAATIDASLQRAFARLDDLEQKASWAEVQAFRAGLRRLTLAVDALRVSLDTAGP